MNRIRLVAIGTILMFALTAGAQQTTSGKGHVPTAEELMKFFTERLDLTAEQQAKIKPILQKLTDETQKAMQDSSKSGEERLNSVRTWRLKTDRKIREVLNDEQKQKLDQVEQGPHPELHGDVHG